MRVFLCSTFARGKAIICRFYKKQKRKYYQGRIVSQSSGNENKFAALELEWKLWINKNMFYIHYFIKQYLLLS